MAAVTTLTRPLRVSGSVSPSPYPLQGPCARLAMWAATIVGIAFLSPAAAISFFVLWFAVGALWRRDESPVLAFCVAYQWLFVVTGFFLYRTTGVYPGLPAPARLEAAILLSLVGFLALIAGMRAAFRGLCPTLMSVPSPSPYEPRRLFWAVVALYVVSWFIEIIPAALTFRAAQPLHRLLEFRAVLLFILVFSVIQQNRGYPYAVTGTLFALIPSFNSMMSSAFAGILLLILIALMTAWRPWSGSSLERRRSALLARASIPLVVVIVAAALFWNGHLKPVWRHALLTGTVAGSPVHKIVAFLDVVKDGAANPDPPRMIESLATRLSSGAAYFAYVLERVPESVPHEGGRLTWRAIQHVVTPRFLYPEKPNLGSDSWLVRHYAGIDAAGEESNTSVGLGYMAQFYIDFGIPGMFLPLWVYGLLLGAVYGGLLRVAPSSALFDGAVAVLFLNQFIGYESEIAKGLGGIVQAFIVYAGILYVFGPWLDRVLSARQATP